MRRFSDGGAGFVSEANAEDVKAAAGSTEPFFIMASDTLDNAYATSYDTSLTPVGATGNGTLLQALTLALIF